MAGNLKVGIDVLDVTLNLLQALHNRGITIVDLQAVCDDTTRLNAVVEAIQSPDKLREARLQELATLADIIDEKRVQRLLKAVFPQYPHLVRLYTNPIKLNSLLTGMHRGGSWERAAVVMYYGLGRDGRTYTAEQIAETIERSRRTVGTFLSLTAESLSTARHKLESSHFNQAMSPQGDIAWRTLPLDVRDVLHNGYVRSFEQLRCCTAEELRTLFNEWSAQAEYDHLMEILQRRNVQLWQ